MSTSTIPPEKWRTIMGDTMKNKNKISKKTPLPPRKIETCDQVRKNEGTRMRVRGNDQAI
jgi:hypothetical protein